MDLEFYFKVSLLGILHWVLAGMLLRDLAHRERVLGGRKAIWVILIVFATFLGSVLYLLCHPRIFLDDNV